MSKEKYIMTETHKQKISKANKGQVPWNKGKHWSEIIKLKMSKIAKKIGTGRWILGRKRAYEEKKAIGEKLKNYYKTHIHHAKGKHCSLQHRKNVSKALTGRIFLERRGSGSPRWTGGKIKVNGYIKIYCPEHPFANKKYVLEHRLLVEKRLKRFLKSFEVVHHINGVKNDNRLENLYLFTKRDHDKFESNKNKEILFSNVI